MSEYHRYHIDVQPAPNVAPHPNRFRVRVRRFQLAKLILGELLHYRFNMPVVMSRPCVYGVFSGPIGGFAPRPQHCVGCLRCTVQYPDIVRIEPNPERLHLGDSYFTPEHVDTVTYEASTGRVPVRGAGYRGAFGGSGWDGMWTDMSEIVRPTRDGIHGREFISTSVDLGEKPAFLTLDPSGRPIGERPRVIPLPVPFFFDIPPRELQDRRLLRTLVDAAEALQTLVIAPLRNVLENGLSSSAVVPLVQASRTDELARLATRPRLIEMDGWEEAAWNAVRKARPESLICVRHPFPCDVVTLARKGARLLHLTADYHGNARGHFVGDAIRAAHDALVAEGLREQVTLIGSGGIIAAEHVPKAIICGLDAVALDTTPLIAIQARFEGQVVDAATARASLFDFPHDWAVQRLKNLFGAWRDQLLEILGAMGMREVRRLRGEVGRAMFQADVEREAFAGIEGFEG